MCKFESYDIYLVFGDLYRSIAVALVLRGVVCVAKTRLSSVATWLFQT